MSRGAKKEYFFITKRADIDLLFFYLPRITVVDYFLRNASMTRTILRINGKSKPTAEAIKITPEQRQTIRAIFFAIFMVVFLSFLVDAAKASARMIL